MYQTRTKSNEKNFQELYRAFKQTVFQADLPKHTEEWDIQATYAPNWACSWNKKENVGKECKILEKNDEIALVTFKEAPLISLEGILTHIYRLEDLTKLDKNGNPTF